jgi:hypothetical protein
MRHILAIAVLTFAGVSAHGYSRYKVTPMYQSFGDERQYISKSGAISSASGALWTESQGLHYLPTSAYGNGTYVLNISDSGIVCGTIEIGYGPNDPKVGFTYTAESGYTYYSRPGSSRIAVHDINAQGYAVGGGVSISSTSFAGALSYWSPGNTTTPVMTTFDMQGSYLQITDSNWVYSGFGGNCEEIGQIGGPPVRPQFSGEPMRRNVFHVTEGGLIYGASSRTAPGTMPFRYFIEIFSPTGQRLHSFSRNDYSPMQVRAISDSGVMLGLDSRVTVDEWGPMSLWNPISGESAVLANLIEPGAAGWEMTWYDDMNDNLQIVGKARNAQGQNWVVRLDPVPEPATILALSAGMAGILARRRKGKDSPAP